MWLPCCFCLAKKTKCYSSRVSNILVLTENGNPDNKQALLQGSVRAQHQDGVVSLNYIVSPQLGALCPSDSSHCFRFGLGFFSRVCGFLGVFFGGAFFFPPEILESE